MEQLYYTLTEATAHLKMDVIQLGERGLLAMAYRHRETSNTEKTGFVIEYIKPGWEAVSFSYVTAAQFGKIVNATRTQDRAILRDLFSTLEELADSDEIIKRRNKGVHLQAEKLLFSGVKISHIYAGLDDMFVTAEAMRAYMAAIDAPATDTATPAPVETDGIDFTMVATRKELIDAFGGVTKMDLTWFDNLTDAPKLKAARKYKGQGGRNSAEPLFCPFEVLQWLIDPKRKKGQPINDTTAWRRLKSHFPKVYNHHSIGDPNAD